MFPNNGTIDDPQQGDVVTDTPQTPENQTERFPCAVGDKGGIYPRWPYFATMIMTPFSLIGYGLNEWYLHRPCTIGSWCHLDQIPGVLQFFLMIVFFLLIWLLAFVFGVGPLEINLTRVSTTPFEESQPSGYIAHFFWQITNFQQIKPMLIGAGILTASLLAFSELNGAIPPSVLGVATMLLATAFCTLLWRANPAVVSLATQDINITPYIDRLDITGPIYIFRTLPLIVRIWPPMLPPQTGQGTLPTDQATP